MFERPESDFSQIDHLMSVFTKTALFLDQLRAAACMCRALKLSPRAVCCMAACAVLMLRGLGGVCCCAMMLNRTGPRARLARHLRAGARGRRAARQLEGHVDSKRRLPRHLARECAGGDARGSDDGCVSGPTRFCIT
jgi:hypothetical protein